MQDCHTQAPRSAVAIASTSVLLLKNVHWIKTCALCAEEVEEEEDDADEEEEEEDEEMEEDSEAEALAKEPSRPRLRLR